MTVFVIEGVENFGAGNEYRLVGATTTLDVAKEIGDRQIADPEKSYEAMFVTEMDGETSLAVWRKDGREGEWFVHEGRAAAKDAKEDR